MNEPQKLVLLTNDDGYWAAGITALHRHIQKLAQVVIVAPDRERSATSLALTLHHPLRVKEIGTGLYAVDGTPADCVYLAMHKLLPRKPDLIVSGVNNGPNLGQQDVAYSGTVAGAVQGTFFGIPSMAVSCLSDIDRAFDFDYAAGLARKLAALEQKYDAQFKAVFDAIRQLMAPPEPTKESIGFRSPGKGKKT